MSLDALLDCSFHSVKTAILHQLLLRLCHIIRTLSYYQDFVTVLGLTDNLYRQLDVTKLLWIQKEHLSTTWNVLQQEY